MLTRKTRFFLATASLIGAVLIVTTFLLSQNSSPAVNEDIMKVALESTPPVEPIMSEAITFFENRLTSRNGNDLVARKKLIEAYLLQFKAYGNPLDLKNAKQHTQWLLENRGIDASLHATSSAIQMAGHDFNGAVKAARKAVSETTGDHKSAATLRLFDALFAYGDYEEAEWILHTENFNRRSLDFLVREARLLDKMGDFKYATEHMQKALYQAKAYAQPPVVIAWCLVTLGHFEHHGGHPEKAVTQYVKALKHLPGYPAALEGLAAISHTIDRNPDAANRLYLKALENGGELDIYLNLSKIAQGLDKREQADKYRRIFIREATRNFENERLFYRPLAFMLSEEISTQPQALKYARMDLENRPTSESYDTLAWVLYQSGEVAEAKVAAEKAIAWGAPEPTVLYHAGRIFIAAGENEKAKTLLTKALGSASELGTDIIDDIHLNLQEN